MLINYYPREPGMRGYSGAQFLAEFVMERDKDSMFQNKDYFAAAWAKAAPTRIDTALDLALRRVEDLGAAEQTLALPSSDVGLQELKLP